MKGKAVTAKYPNHVWHLDLTAVPVGTGFWVPWFPFSPYQCWPFCWWVAVAIDHTSRLVVGNVVFPRRPSTFAVCSFLKRAMLKAGTRPKYIITDKGTEFFCRAFKRWCKRRQITTRYGAIGEHGSIAVIERFMRTLKSEGTRRILVPLNLHKARSEIGVYVAWYNMHRPHRGLGGRTPVEVYTDQPPANEAPRFETRLRWPVESQCARPVAPTKGERGVELELRVNHFEGKRHLPVVDLTLAA